MSVAIVAPLALAAPVSAKDVRVRPHVATAAEAPLTPQEAEAPLTPEERAALERALNFDAIALESTARAPSIGGPTLAHPQGLSVRRSDHADGSSTVTVARPLSRDGDVKVGADLNVAAAPATTYQPDRPLPRAAENSAPGAVWASMGVTRFASIDARIDPAGEQGTLGTTLEHSVRLGDDVSVTLHSHYAVSDRLPRPAEQEATAPVLSNDQNVRLNIASTGTTLSAGMSANSTDPVTHNTLSADQKVYGPLHVTTAITDAGQPNSNKSVAAGFNLTW